MAVVKKNALTIDDLIKFCEEKKMYKFSSDDQGYKVSVQVPATFEIDENADDDHRGMLKLKFKIFHTGLNRNKSYVSEEAAKDAMPTIKNRPILAAIHQLDNGEWDFEAHNFEIVTNEDTGESETVYIEKQVGSFDESEPFFEYDEELDKTFVCSYGYIPEGYTRAADILRKKNGTKNSCELSIDEFSYNAKDHYLSLDKFYVAASTLLGSHSDGTEIKEGMQGSRADIVEFEEFSSCKNAMQFNQDQELLSELKKLNENLSLFNTNLKFKEGGNDPVNKFEELLEKYGKTVEDIEFDYENMSDEELESKFEEVFCESKDDVEDTEDVENQNEVNDDTDETTAEEEKTSTSELENNDDNEEDAADFETNDSVKIEKYSITMSDGSVKEFSLSLDEIIDALYQLVNDMYGEADNTYYSVYVYEDNTLIMRDWWNNKAYKQSYSREDDNFSLVGDRVEVFSIWVTKEEEEALNEMKANYSSISDQLAKYQSEEIKQKKDEILSDKAYEEFADSDEFKEIIKNVDSYTVEELSTKCELAFAKLVKTKGTFSFTEKKETKRKNKIGINFSNEEESSDPYGDYFKSLEN